MNKLCLYGLLITILINKIKNSVCNLFYKHFKITPEKVYYSKYAELNLIIYNIF